MRLISLTLFSIATQTGCAAWGDRLSEEGRVLQTNDNPCFAVADNIETKTKQLELSTIHVSEIIGIGTKVRWEISSIKDGNLISPNECISYGDTLKLMKTETQPIALDIGKKYEMGIGSYILKSPPNKWERREYRANFCMTKNEVSQKFIVHQVYYDESLGKVRWDICGITN